MVGMVGMVSVVWYGAVWCGMVWYGMVPYHHRLWKKRKKDAGRQLLADPNEGRTM